MPTELATYIMEHAEVEFHPGAIATAMIAQEHKFTVTGKYGPAELIMYTEDKIEQYHPERNVKSLVFRFRIDRPNDWTVNSKRYHGEVYVKYYLSGPHLYQGQWNEASNGPRWSVYPTLLTLNDSISEGTPKGRKAIEDECLDFAKKFDLNYATVQATRNSLLQELKSVENKLRVALVEMDDLKAKQAKIMQDLLIEGIDIDGRAGEANAEADRAEADTRGQLSADTPTPQPLVVKPAADPWVWVACVGWEEEDGETEADARAWATKMRLSDTVAREFDGSIQSPFTIPNGDVWGTEAAAQLEADIYLRTTSQGIPVQKPKPLEYWLAAAVPAREQFMIPPSLVPMAFRITLNIGVALFAPSAYDKRAINETWYPNAEQALKAAQEYVDSRNL